MKYSVHMIQTVSATVEVEADDVADALEKVYDAPGMPGSMVYGAFGGDNSADEAGEWRPVVVYAGDNYDKPVWEDRD